jgi:3'-phosphoadenosine 5'-phosphosulfate (PAPS) 3'-phosphatase/thiamine kinase-like enzyme
MKNATSANKSNLSSRGEKAALSPNNTPYSIISNHHHHRHHKKTSSAPRISPCDLALSHINGSLMILISNAVMKTISLSQLLSSCMDAAYQGCEIIQGFQNGGDAVQGTLKESDNIRSVVTQADVDAQARIIGGLRKTWGDDLLIIGEEDEADAPPHYDGEGLRRDILDEQCSLEKDEKIPLDELTIFVDPLDGTREFVELRLEHVACLIGISRNNRPVAGVIGVPFPDGTPGSTVEIHYAVSDQPEVAGVWPKSDRTETISATEFEGLTILTGDSSDPVLVNATKCAKAIVENHRHVIVGGTAAKLRLVAAGIPDSVAILHFKTELWDTCSAEALLLSKGGKVTDLFGSPLVHSPARPFGNVFGVVASSGGSDKAAKVHEELCRRMRADGEAVHKIFGKWMGDSIPTTPQAIDIARDLEGLPFSLEYIQDLLKDENPKDLPLVSYSIPESDAWRGMMSNGVRLCLDWKGNGSDHLPVSDIFYKRIVMADLAHARDKLKTAPHKLVRDVKSYQIEIGFLTSKACQCLIKEAGLKLNKVLGSDLRPSPADLGPEYQLESRFSIFLEYFQNSDGWKHQWLLGEEATKATLEELAKMHAYFWEGSQFWKKDGGKIGKELESIVWPNGGYMQPHLQGKEQLEKVHNGWKARYPSFEEDLSELTELEGADLKSLGKRLEAIAPSVGDMAHPFAESSNAGKAFSRYRTLIHGDPKQANFFFRRNPKSKKLEVGLIDFQWSGFGLAATDVAHHLTAAVMPDCLSLDGKKEKTLLDHYHSCLVRYLVKFGSASSEVEVEETIFPRAVLQEQYETAFLDVCRLVFAYAWRRWKPESTPAPESLNRNAYNKSLPNVLWLITRCHVLLEKAKQPAVRKYS